MAPPAGAASMLDLEALAQPAPSESPSGPNLQYSPEYANLERAAAGKPERQVGAAIVPAEPPDWRAVRDQAGALLVTSKDLRVAVYLVRALLELQAFDGLAGGVRLVRRLVEEQWLTLHPQLDAEDNDDPTFRVNALAGLTHRDVLQAIRSAPLVTSKAFGSVSLRALDGAAAPRAAGSKATPGPSAGTLEAAFQQVTPEVLSQAVATLTLCVQEAAALATGWAERLPGAGPDFTEFRRALLQAQQAVRTRMDQRQGDAAQPNGDGSTTGTAPDVAEAPAAAIRGEVRSRDDVLRAIDAICAYYARAEPSSPVPLLLQRCRRMVTMSFVDILKEMLPESVAGLQKIAGKTDA
jgi:type VI secretion system protein ImpA